MRKRIKILTSAMGLGTYIPALHILDYLKRNHFVVDMGVFESFFDESTLSKYSKTKEMFQSDYRAAILGHKLAAKKLNFSLDDTTTNRILKEWTEESIDTFIILSGNWISIVSKYLNRFKDVKAIIVHMDIGVAPSFKNFSNKDNKFIEICPIDRNGVNFIIDNHFDNVQKTYPKIKKNQFFLHGGGWGMGTYMSKLEELTKKLSIPVITTINDKKDCRPDKNIEYYMMEPNWKPWIKNDINHFSYPPMYKIKNENKNEKIKNEYSNGLYKLYHSCLGIISKPGGSTLMDSLITETPIIFLESIAQHEKVNETVWTELGFGLPYETWLHNEDRMKILNKMQENIKKCKSNTSYLGLKLIKELG